MIDSLRALVSQKILKSNFGISSLLVVFFSLISFQLAYAQPLEWRDVEVTGMPTASVLVRDSVYSGGRYTAVGNLTNNNIYISADGYSWTVPVVASGTCPTCIRYGGITYNGSIYIAGGANSNNNSTYFAKSTNGTSWTGENKPTTILSSAINDVASGGGYFVAVGAGSHTTPNSAYSTDGITWAGGNWITDAFTVGSTTILSVAYGNSKFVAVSLNMIGTSADGASWASTTSAVTGTQTTIAYGNGTFVIATNGANYLTSPDGTTWTTRAYGSVSGTDVRFINNQFILDGRWTSSDGITWTYSGLTQRSNYVTPYLGVLYDGSKYIGFNQASDKIAVASLPTMGIVTGATTTLVLSSTQALLSATYHDDGGSTTTARGICWGASPSPVSNCTSVATSTGTYTQTVTGLTAKTLLYFRGYATNASGTAYSPDATITPTLSPVTLATVTPTDSQATATYTLPPGVPSSVIVLRKAGSAVTETPTDGVAYVAGNTIGGATVGCVDSTVVATTTDSCLITGLTNGTSYHFAIFARDTSGNYSTSTVPTGSPATPNVTTYIDNGVDPASTSTAPGTSVSAGAFTTNTSQGSDVISALVVDVGSTLNSSVLSGIQITSDNGSIVYGSTTPSSFATTTVTLSVNTLTAVTTPTQYKIRLITKPHSNLLDPREYNISPTIQSWTSTNVLKYNSDASTTLIKLDNQPPTIPGSYSDWSTSSSSANTIWNSVAYGNGLFVAVSSSGTGNRVMTSPDGITWTSRTSAADIAWEGVTYGNGLFVAVSSSGTTNRVMTSPDGITWTSRTTPNANFTSITYGNGLFVAAGNGVSSAQRFMTSPDGITWTARGASFGHHFTGVAYGAGVYVAVPCATSGTSCASGSASYHTSPDGITWTARNHGNSSLWHSITYGNGLFVAVAFSNGGGPTVITSPDGFTWTNRTSPPSLGWKAVTYGGGLFVAVACGTTFSTCNTFSTNRIMTSPDGVTWTAVMDPADNQWQSVAYGNGTFVAVGETGTGNRVMKSSLVFPAASALYNAAIVQYTTPADTDTERFVIIQGTSTISDTLVDGTVYSPGSAVGTNYVVCVDSSVTPSVSDSCRVDGLTNGTPYYFKLFAKDIYGNYSEGLSLAPITPGVVTELGTGVDPVATTTAPGSDPFFADTFTLQTSIGTDVITSVVVNLGSNLTATGTRLIEVTSSDGSVVYGSSTNPTNATTSVTLNLNTLTANTTLTSYKIRITPKTHATMPISPGSDYILNAVISSFSSTNSKYLSDTSHIITIDNSSPGPIPVASVVNINTWTQQVGFPLDGSDIRYNNGLFISTQTANSAIVDTSPDGTNWVQRTTNISYQKGVAYGNGTYVVVGGNSTNGDDQVVSSSDGISWIQRNSPNGVWRSVAFGNNLFVAVSCGQGNFGASCNATTSKKVMTSPDGITWTARNSADDTGYWSSITYGNGLFVAVQESCTINCVMTSTNGVDWVTRTTSLGESWLSITYGTSTFVVVGDAVGENNVMTSPDGINWTLRSAVIPGNADWVGVAYGGGYFAAVASTLGVEGDQLMTSPDGITWSANSAINGIDHNSITYGLNRFVTVSETYIFTTSATSTVLKSESDNSVTLIYKASDELDLGSVIVLYSTSTITAVPAEGSTYSVGDSIGSAKVGCIDTSVLHSTLDSCEVAGLTNGTSYNFKIFEGDIYNNYSSYGLTATGTPIAGTNLGNGSSDPAVTTIGPGFSPTVVDSFTFRSSVSDTISSLVIDFSTSTLSTISLVEVTSSNGSVVYGSAANPTNSTTSISLSGLTSNNILTEYKIRVTPKSSAGMPGTLTYPIRAYVASWTGTNLKYGSDTSGTVIIDNEPPAPPTIPSALLTPGEQILLQYNNPSNSFSGVLVLRSSSITSDIPVKGVAYSVGDTIGASIVTCVRSAVTINTADTCTYSNPARSINMYFRIFAKDSANNYSTAVVPSAVPIKIIAPNSGAYILEVEPFSGGTATTTGGTDQGGGTSGGTGTTTSATTTTSTSTPGHGGGGGDVGYAPTKSLFAGFSSSIGNFVGNLVTGGAYSTYASAPAQAVITPTQNCMSCKIKKFFFR